MRSAILFVVAGLSLVEVSHADVCPGYTEGSQRAALAIEEARKRGDVVELGLVETFERNAMISLIRDCVVAGQTDSISLIDLVTAQGVLRKIFEDKLAQFDRGIATIRTEISRDAGNGWDQLLQSQIELREKLAAHARDVLGQFAKTIIAKVGS